MTTDQTISIGLVIAMIGAFATIYNYITAKSLRAKTDGQWQGRVDEKLDSILTNFKSIKDEVHEIREDINKLHTRVTVLEKKRTTKADIT